MDSCPSNNLIFFCSPMTFNRRNLSSYSNIKTTGRQWNGLCPTSGHKMKVGRASETSVNSYHTARRHIPEDISLAWEGCTWDKRHTVQMGYPNKVAFRMSDSRRQIVGDLWRRPTRHTLRRQPVCSMKSPIWWFWFPWYAESLMTKRP
jgi:hypothetical protein